MLQSKLNHNYRVCALELWNCNYQALEPQPLKPMCPGACARQQEKQPWEWEARALRPESSAHSRQLEKSPHNNEDPVQPINTAYTNNTIIQINTNKYKLKKKIYRALGYLYSCKEFLSISMLLTIASPHTILLIKSFMQYF